MSNYSPFKCPVCDEFYDEYSSKPLCLDCGHVLCEECYHSITNEFFGKKCPKCNNKIAKRSYPTVYDLIIKQDSNTTEFELINKSIEQEINDKSKYNNMLENKIRKTNI